MRVLLVYDVKYQVREEDIREDTPSWFVCTLLSKPKYKNGAVCWSWKNSKTIYCEKNASEFQAEWVDGDTVRINGRLLNVPGDTYDYRWDWRTWLG